MTQRPLLFIHGWSDNAGSFRRLAQLLQSQIKCETRHINLADYVTMDDDITFDDIVAAMSQAWQRENLPKTPGATDVVVHSTGGLVIRDWLNRNFTPDMAPIKHLVMLAPANFGSQLAHKGQSFFGRVLKGFNSIKLFQIGIKILQGLELASPYSWQLAMQDRFGKSNFYGPNKILCTVLVGNAGFTGISAAGNENGSDGVVRISTANMNCAFLDADYSHNPQQPTFTLKTSTGKTAFAVIDGENHSTIVAKDGGFKNPETLNYIARALTVTDEGFNQWCGELNRITTQVMQKNSNDVANHGFQNNIFLVRNQFGEHIQDYFLEFHLRDGKSKNWFAEIFYHDIIQTVHAYTHDKSYRSVYTNCTLLNQKLLENPAKPWDCMNLSVTALPDLARNGNVGYRSFVDKHMGAINLSPADIAKIFIPHRSLLVRITLKREQTDKVFKIHKLV